STGITDMAGNPIASGFISGQTYVLDHTPPSVLSINRQSPSTANTNGTSVSFRVIFSESVTGVDVSDFSLNKSGNLNGSLAADAVTVVGTLGTTYDVNISNISGDGSLALVLNSTGTGIVDIANNAVNSAFSAGESYEVNHSSP